MTSTNDFVIELARHAGQVEAEQLAAAVERQRALTDEFGVAPPLTSILVEQGVITERALCDLLAADLGLRVVELAGRRIAGEVLGCLTRDQVLHYRVLPLQRRGDLLELAVVDPLDLTVVDEIGHLLGLTVETVLVTESDLRAAQERCYGGDSTEVAVASEDDGGATSGMTGGAEADDAPIIRLVYRLIAAARRQRASDIHLEPLERRLRVRYRIDGRLREVESPAKRLQLPLISRIKIMADLSIAEKRLPQDGRIQLEIDGQPIDLRVSTVPTAHGESVVMRILDAEGLKVGFTELGLWADDEAQLRSLVGLADGMVLVTGPTGSGKTTTLYACLHGLNRADRKIITVEDPVEYQLTGVNQVPVRAEIGLTFAAALRAMLRQAPNVVMVGEIRDRETAEIAINAALTGHLVFSTLHTNDAPGAVTRLMDLGMKPFLVANALRAVVAQRLVRRVCTVCRVPAPPTVAEEAVLHAAGLAAEAGGLCRGAGCETCGGTGYRGRVAIFEFFVVKPSLERMIHGHASLSPLRDHARRLGMRTLREDGLRKAVAGLTTLDEVLAATVSDPLSLSP